MAVAEEDEDEEWEGDEAWREGGEEEEEDKRRLFSVCVGRANAGVALVVGGDDDIVQGWQRGVLIVGK